MLLSKKLLGDQVSEGSSNLGVTGQVAGQGGLPKVGDTTAPKDAWGSQERLGVFLMPGSGCETE